MQDLEQKFVALIQQNQGILHKVCNTYAKDPDEKADLMQEVTLQLWRAFPTFRGEAKITTWMYRVALNTAISFYRRDKKRKDEVTLEDKALHIAEQGVDEEKQDRLRRMHLAIQQLSPIEKSIIMLYLEDTPYDEISATVGISENNLRVRISRIKDKIQRILKIEEKAK